MPEKNTRPSRKLTHLPGFAMNALTPWHWLLVASLLVAAAAWLGYVAGADLRRERLGNRIAEYAALHARLIPSELGGYDMLSYASQAPVLEDALLNPGSGQEVRRAQRFLNKLAEDSNSASALLADHQGRIVAASDIEFVGADVSFRPYFQSAIAGEHGTFLALAIFSEELSYFVSQPLTDETGSVIGVLVIKRALARDDYFGRTTDERFLSFLTDRHGVIFLSDVTEWNFTAFRPLNDVQRREIDRHQQYENQALPPLDWQVVETISPRQAVARFPISDDEGTTREFLLHSEPMPTLGWELHILADLSDIPKDASVYALGTGGLAAVVALLAVGFMQREKYRQSLLRQAIRDPLTGLYTRLFMHEHLHHIFGAQDRGEIRHLSLILLDLDQFKPINDTMGHNAGDMVMKQVDDILIDNKRQSDVVVRYGGEEFAMFCSETDVDGARLLAERIRREVESTRFRVNDESVRVTLSAGVAGRTKGQTLDKLVDTADSHLYEAKHAGRNRVH
jgi:diguanylate cyclase (GGDEF)-like protein